MAQDGAHARTDRSSRFAREGGRNRFTARRARVIAVTQPSVGFVRITLGGDDFHDFVSTGPADHIRLFFPDPVTGELVAPVASGPAEDGIVRPDGPTINRDYTPLHPRSTDDGEGRVVDVDFALHDDPGPATQWAASAAPGDEIVVVGPRGSKRAPQEIDGLLVIVDDSALPSASRWLRESPASASVSVIAFSALSADDVRQYLSSSERPDFELEMVEPADSAALLSAVRSASIGEGTYVFAAGEAGSLIPVRHHLRQERELLREQVVVSGYWRAGVSAFDHNEPLDPSDPD